LIFDLRSVKNSSKESAAAYEAPFQAQSRGYNVFFYSDLTCTLWGSFSTARTSW
jgi:hypothetical protein